MADPDPAALRRISHDARNLLAAAHLSVQGLANETLTARGAQRVTILRSALERLAKLLEELESMSPPAVDPES